MNQGDTMQGRRLPDYPEAAAHDVTFSEGDYCRLGGEWWVRPPGSHLGTLDSRHIVTEHDDGTITVEPSIQGDPTSDLIVTQDGTGWHGYLEHGVWRQA